MKKILFIGMDNVLMDIQSGLDQISEETKAAFEGRAEEIPGIFALMQPIPGALDAFQALSEYFDTYILSKAPWESPSAWYDKLDWVKKHLGTPAFKRLILTNHYDLDRGDFLIDNRNQNEAEEFHGVLIEFDPSKSKWPEVVDLLLRFPD